MTNEVVLREATKLESERGGFNERDYKVIVQVWLHFYCLCKYMYCKYCLFLFTQIFSPLQIH